MATCARRRTSRLSARRWGGVAGAAAIVLASALAVSAQTTRSPQIGTGVTVPNTALGRQPAPDISIQQGQQTLQQRQMQQQRVTNDVRQSIDNASQTPIPKVD